MALALGLLLIGLLVTASLWLANPHEAMTEVESSFMSDSVVKVNQARWIVFEPRAGTASRGLILYPGGRVVPEAYAPAARSVAESGYLVVIVPMPLNLAVTDPNAALEVIQHFPNVQHWAIGGHSLGGAMAARFAHNNPHLLDGLVLWAAFPAQSDSLRETSLAVSSIYGTEDGLATEEEILASAPLLPSQTEFVAIQGGNHAQFGWYGQQSGDGRAAISRPNQQQIIIEATTQLLARMVK